MDDLGRRWRWSVGSRSWVRRLDKGSGSVSRKGARRGSEANGANFTSRLRVP